MQLIWLISGTVGFLQGLTIGWGLALVLFVIHYSQLHVVQSGISAVEYSSEPTARSDRTEPHSQLPLLPIEQHPIYLLKLQGFLFFGNANSLLEQVRQRLTQATPIQFIILDFQQVSDVDVSAAQSLVRIQQLTSRRGVTLVLCSLSISIHTKLQQVGEFQNQTQNVEIFSSLAEAIEQCHAQPYK